MIRAFVMGSAAIVGTLIGAAFWLATRPANRWW
jgi:hypothetical protein